MAGYEGNVSSALFGTIRDTPLDRLAIDGLYTGAAVGTAGGVVYYNCLK